MQVAYKKTKQHPHKQQATPTHKIEAWEAKNSSNLLRSKNLSKNHQTCHIKKINKFIWLIGQKLQKKKDFGLGFKLII